MRADDRRGGQRPKKRNTLTERVGLAIRERISTGEFAVGDKLPKEKDLIAEFEVSRTVIREALAQLSAEGSIDIRHGVGAFVLHRDKAADAFLAEDFGRTSAILDLFELRRGVEIEAAGLAALRRSPAQEAAIREAYQTLKAASERGEAAPELDLDLHRAIARGTNNRFFVEFLDFLADRAVTRAVEAGYGGDQALRLDRMEQLQSEHRSIVEAISVQDAPTARTAMRTHLMASESRFRALAMQTL